MHNYVLERVLNTSLVPRPVRKMGEAWKVHKHPQNTVSNKRYTVSIHTRLGSEEARNLTSYVSGRVRGIYGSIKWAETTIGEA